MPLHPAKQANSIARFRHAQDKKWPKISREIAAGVKETHWMWYVFPQLRVFAKSETAYYYGLADKAEALTYLDDDTLRIRLATASMGVLRQDRLMFEDVDRRKLHRCVTLFAELVKDRTILDQVLAKHFAGEPHQPTLDVLAGKPVKSQWTRPDHRPLKSVGTAMGQVEWKQGTVGRHWEKQIERARATVAAVGAVRARPDNVPMDSSEIESFLKGFGLSAAAVRGITRVWVADQSRANQQGWDAAEEEAAWQAQDC